MGYGLPRPHTNTRHTHTHTHLTDTHDSHTPRFYVLCMPVRDMILRRVSCVPLLDGVALCVNVESRTCVPPSAGMGSSACTARHGVRLRAAEFVSEHRPRELVWVPRHQGVEVLHRKRGRQGSCQCSCVIHIEGNAWRWNLCLRALHMCTRKTSISI